MKPILASVLLAATSAFAAEGALQDHPLTEIKATIQIPAGWETKMESEEEGVFVYRFARPGAPAQGEQPSVTLSVTTKVPSRAGQPVESYAVALLDEGNKLVKGESNGLRSIRSEYDIDLDSGKIHSVNVALANSKTGTLYFFAWQSPVNEPAELEAVREKILSSARFDPSL